MSIHVCVSVSKSMSVNVSVSISWGVGVSACPVVRCPPDPSEVEHCTPVRFAEHNHRQTPEAQRTVSEVINYNTKTKLYLLRFVKTCSLRHTT